MPARRRAALAILLEDAHAADASSLQLLDVARHLRRGRVLLVARARRRR
ncbi:MAG: hypothetical protein U1F43_16245 [Myxococcota bacterium]